MADINIAITKTLAREGGARYTEIPGDKGGATKFGISQAAYPAVDIKNLTETQAREIYKRDYWDLICGDSIASQMVANSIFDSAVNMGVRTTTKLAQLSVDAAADGVMGAGSIALINAMNAEYFLAIFCISKIARYVDICNKDKSQDKFLRGWLNRSLGAYQ